MYPSIYTYARDLVDLECCAVTGSFSSSFLLLLLCCPFTLLYEIYAMALSCPYTLKTINSIWNHHNIYFTVVSYNIPTHTHADMHTLIVTDCLYPVSFSFFSSSHHQSAHVSFVFDTEVVWYYILFCWILRACMSVCVCVCMYVLLLLLYLFINPFPLFGIMIYAYVH